MIRHNLAVSLVCLLVLECFARAEEAYTIKIKSEAKGDVIKTVDKESMAMKIRLVAGGVETVENVEEGHEFQYTETILELNEKDGRPSKLAREYAKARKTDEDGDAKLGLDGKTVLIERKEDKYEFSLKDGGELSESALEHLNGDFNADSGRDAAQIERLLMPDKAVKVGETWKIDAEKAIQLLSSETEEMEFDHAKSSARGKLTKVYQKGGSQFGVLDFTLELAVKNVNFGGIKGDAAGSKFSVRMILDICIDGTRHDGKLTGEFNAKLKAAFKGADGAEAGAIEMNVKGTSETTMQEVKK